MLTKTTFQIFTFVALLILAFACSKDDDDSMGPVDPGPVEPVLPSGTSQIPESSQRSGDPIAGKEYLLYGDYVSSGIPYNLFLQTVGEGDNLLGRTGDNDKIPFGFTAVDAPNGVRVVSANCMQCHTQELNGELVLGLGNGMGDFTADQSTVIPLADLAIQFTFGNPSDEWDAYEPFRRAALVTSPELVTEVRGVNSAGKLAVVLAAHRNQNDLTWSEDPVYPVPSEVIPEDVPAWWLMKKKNALYFNASGKGDFARLSMASSLLTLQDTVKAREVDERFADVIAFINTLEPPLYPEAIDAEKLARGATIFSDNCAKCHGTYGDTETYPNLLVSLDQVRTDSLLVYGNFAFGDFENWYKDSWFSKGPNASNFTPERGYIAPPLDGIWATAPYLHNGSVPTLEDLLNSSQRPTFWKRTFNSSDIDYEKMGWNYTEESAGGSTDIYDTTLPGYGNMGHTFGDSLSEDERSDLIEYLKSI